MAKNVKVPVLQVHSKRPSFRRVGFQFGSDPVNLPVKELTRAQIDAIKSEPLLVAVETEIEVVTD